MQDKGLELCGLADGVCGWDEGLGRLECDRKPMGVDGEDLECIDCVWEEEL